MHLGIIQIFYAHMNRLQKKSKQHVDIHKKQFVMNHNLNDNVVASIFVRIILLVCFNLEIEIWSPNVRLQN
jgi:hypothetical protein